MFSCFHILHLYPIDPVCTVVFLGPTRHAVPSLRFVLDLLEEVRWAPAAYPSGWRQACARTCQPYAICANCGWYIEMCSQQLWEGGLAVTQGLWRLVHRWGVTKEKIDEESLPRSPFMILFQEFRTQGHLYRHCQAVHGLTVRNQGASRIALKTRQAFYLHTTKLTRIARRLCHDIFHGRQAARRPFIPINATAIKAQCAVDWLKSPITQWRSSL